MKKKEILVGIVGGDKKPPRKKNTPTIFWRDLVKVWFDTFGELVPPPPGEDIAVPSFDSVETFQLKVILRELKKRAEDKGVEWTKEIACDRFKKFIQRAYDDDFTSRNFMLKIISSRRSLIFNNQINPKKDGGQEQRGIEKRFGNNTGRATPTSDSKIKALGKWGLGANSCNDKSNTDN